MIQLPGSLALRFTTPRDEDFLLDMFIAARPLLALSSQDRDFVRHLYEDQQRITRLGTGARYPEHLSFIVEKVGQAVGHLVVDLGYADWRLSQLEMHPQARGKGIGGDIVRGLQNAAEKLGMPLRVSTPMAMEAAVRFYLRLGFQAEPSEPPMCHLVWLPPKLRQLAGGSLAAAR